MAVARTYGRDTGGALKAVMNPTYVCSRDGQIARFGDERIAKPANASR